MSKRVEFFNGRTFTATRGECLRALIAAIYRTAKEHRLFTTDDVFAQLGTEYNEHDFRVTTGPSKLVAVALKKVRDQGSIKPSPSSFWTSGPVSHGRNKRTWVSEVAA